MKISKLSQRLFNVLVKEVRTEIAHLESHDIDYCSTYVLDDVLERFNIRSCKNRDHLARLERACGTTHYVERQGVVSLTAQQMQPVIADDWWLHDTTPADLGNQALALIPRLGEVGRDLAQLGWAKKFAPSYAPSDFMPQAWDESKFLAGVHYQLSLGGYHADKHSQALALLAHSTLKLTVHPHVEFGITRSMKLECVRVGDHELRYVEWTVSLKTHRHREWRLGRAVTKLLLKAMHKLADKLADKREYHTTKSVRTPPNLAGFDPQDFGLALRGGIYLEY